jgi:hypothetical protein
MKYKCDWCGEVITSHQWNESTNNGFDDVDATLKIVNIEEADEECMYICPQCGNVSFTDDIKEVE